MKIKLFFVRIFFVTIALLPILAGTALAETAKPNILVIWGDDIGTWNISHNNRGMVPGTSATTIAA
jgi:arylsulfatase